MRERKCEGCSGRGVRTPALPSCRIDGAPRAWIVVERCDSCERFDDDYAAALSLYEAAGWFQCRDGGWHALADSRSRRHCRSDTGRI